MVTVRRSERPFDSEAKLVDPEETAVHSGMSRLVPLVVFVVLAVITLLVWKQEVDGRHDRLMNHTNDVCYQASRRLEIYTSEKIEVARVFAAHWASHDSHGSASPRFQEIGDLLVDEISGIDAVALVPSNGDEAIVTPDGNGSLLEFLGSDDGRALLAEANRDLAAVVSAPVDTGGGATSIFAAFQFSVAGEGLKRMVVELRSRGLVDGCFGQRIRAEFAFAIADNNAPLYRHDVGGAISGLEQSHIRCYREIPVENRRWTLSMAPDPHSFDSTGWLDQPWIPAFGFPLSLVLSWLVYQLQQRIREHSRIRDDALREVAERQRAEEALRSSESRYRELFETAAEGMIVFDLNGRIAEANSAACVLHGYPAESLVGSSIRELIAEDHQHTYDEFLRKLRRSGAAYVESVDVRLDGSRFDVEVRGSRFFLEDRSAFLAIIADVSERRHAIRQQLRLSRKVLAAQEEERARLSRDLHDGLGQSLTALRFELDWLHGRLDSVEPLAEGFTQVDSLLKDAAEELRSVCRGLRPPLLDDLGLESAICQLVAEFQERNSVPVDLSLELGEGEPSISAEVALITFRVLQESLTNVWRHSDAKGVHVSLTRGPTSLELHVTDDGRGFDLEQLPEHTGFGIAGMRERARLVNGDFDIDSTVGRGTRITLTIPLHPHHEETRQ